MKQQIWLPAALAAIPALIVARVALACGGFCPRDASTGLLSLGLFTAVGVIGAAWILSRKTDERK